RSPETPRYARECGRQMNCKHTPLGRLEGFRTPPPRLRRPTSGVDPTTAQASRRPYRGLVGRSRQRSFSREAFAGRTHKLSDRLGRGKASIHGRRPSPRLFAGVSGSVFTRLKAAFISQIADWEMGRTSRALLIARIRSAAKAFSRP